jgi:hypothetical protein
MAHCVSEDSVEAAMTHKIQRIRFKLQLVTNTIVNQMFGFIILRTITLFGIQTKPETGMKLER